MLDQAEAKLKAEVARAGEIEGVMNSYIMPFIEEKRQILFDAFQSVPVGNVEALKDIKTQLTAINSLEAHFREFITTGKLAEKQLEK